MGGVYEPQMGGWYEDEAGNLFQVLVIDIEDRSVEIQYDDGSMEELDLAAWYEMGLMPHQEPEELGIDDDPYTYGGLVAGMMEDDDAFLGHDWGSPLEHLD